MQIYDAQLEEQEYQERLLGLEDGMSGHAFPPLTLPRSAEVKSTELIGCQTISGQFELSCTLAFAPFPTKPAQRDRPGTHPPSSPCGSK